MKYLISQNILSKRLLDSMTIKTLCIPLFFIVMFACNRMPSDVTLILNKAGDNKKELLKVIEHYKILGDKEKLMAAYFLIGNMEDKVGRQGDFVNNYFPVFYNLHKLHDKKIDGDTINKIIKAQWDSLESGVGAITSHNYPFNNDYNCITAEYLIDNIDLAFRAWREKPWAKHVKFKEFCEYILPYRVYDEPLQSFRKQFFNDFSWLDESLKNKSDPKEACFIINRYVAKKFVFCYMLEKCPMLGVRDMYKLNAGICEHRYTLLTSIMRSLGIPVGIDYSTQYNDISGTHYCMTLLDHNGIFRPFNGGELKISFPDTIIFPLGNGKSTKVYRLQFAQTSNATKKSFRCIPEGIFNQNTLDVTDQYHFPKTDIKIKLDIEPPKPCDLVFLCCFGASYPLIPVDYNSSFMGNVKFKNVGRSAVYLASYFMDNHYIVASYPYYYPEKKTFQILKPDFSKLISVKLVRKFPCFDKKLAKLMVGAKFQASDNKEFKYAVTLYTIDSIHTEFAEKNVLQNQPFRYYRYLSSDTGKICIAELDFFLPGTAYNANKNKQYKIYGFSVNDTTKTKPGFEKAFDGNIATNFNATAKSWVAIDYGKPVKIEKIRFCVRNDLNVIEVGDAYELLYFNKGWVSLGRKIADKNDIIFDKVPDNSLLLLRDLTKGKEERIFVYQSGKQVWL